MLVESRMEFKIAHSFRDLFSLFPSNKFVGNQIFNLTDFLLSDK